MSRFSCFLPDRCMLLFWNHRLISSPKVGVAVPCTVGVRNGFPQTAASLFTSISYCICHDLSRLSTQSYPDPCLIRLLQHKRPEFIQFQYCRLCIVGIRRDERFAQSWQLCGLFLSMKSLRYVTPQMSALALANCFALHRLSESLLGVLLDRHVASDFHGFASRMPDSDISAFHWVLDHSAPMLHSHNGDNVV
jgi:hypothetical protein